MKNSVALKGMGLNHKKKVRTTLFHKKKTTHFKIDVLYLSKELYNLEKGSQNKQYHMEVQFSTNGHAHCMVCITGPHKTISIS